jgi:hypothetical protein
MANVANGALAMIMEPGAGPCCSRKEGLERMNRNITQVRFRFQLRAVTPQEH